MKLKRHKKVKKNILFYVNNYKFRKPYQILIDGTFCNEALKKKFQIREQLPKYFQVEPMELKLLTTRCLFMEVEKLSSVETKFRGALKIMSEFRIHECGHQKKVVSSYECLLSMIGEKNESRYIIATKDKGIQEHLRNVPGVPLLYLHGITPILEHSSLISRYCAKELREDSVMTCYDEKNLKVQKEKFGIVDESKQSLPKSKQKKGGPNPLSCKKKKKKPILELAHKNDKRRKRKKVRIPEHVKEVLLKEHQQYVK